MSFLDGKDITYDPSVLEPPKVEKPVGFWDQFHAANSGGKVLGMHPDNFAMLMGSLAARIAPNTAVGGAGQAVAEYANSQWQQRMKEKEPNYRLGTQKADALQRQTDTVRAGQQQAPQPSGQAPTGFGQKLSLLQPQQPQAPVQPAVGSFVQQPQVDPYFTALGQGEGAAKVAANNMDPWYNQEHQANLENVRSQTGVHTATAAGLNAALPYVGPKALADMQESQGRAKLLNVEATLAEPKFLWQQAVDRANIAHNKAQIGLGYSNLQQNAFDRQEQRNQRLMIEKNQQLQVFDGSFKGLSEKMAKDLENPMTPKHNTYYSYGLQFINKGLQGGEFARSWNDPSFGVIGSNMVYAGVNNIVAGINGAPDVSTKKAMYHDFMTQLKPLQKSNPELFNVLTQQVNSSLKGTTEGYGLPLIGGPLFNKNTFNPSEEFKLYGGR